MVKSLIKSSLYIETHFVYGVRITALHCFIPIITRLAQGEKWAWGDDGWCYFGVVINFFANMFLVLTNFSFVIIGVMDMDRRRFL